MVRVDMKIVFFAILFKLLVSSPMSPACQIVLNVEHEEERCIEVECEDGVKFSIKLLDKDGVSSLDVAGKKAGVITRFLTVTQKALNMNLTLNGKQFDVKDAGSAEEEAVAVESLLGNPDFSLFPTAAHLIHDELELPGWTSPSVMFLYKLAMSLSDHPLLTISLPDSPSLRRTRRFITDQEMLAHDLPLSWYYINMYNGPNPDRKCRHNGYPHPNVEDFTSRDYNCRGMCGPGCDCYKWVCGDCCVHPGCKRHDDMCRDQGMLSRDCVRFRGVFRDTLTSTKRDC